MYILLICVIWEGLHPYQWAKCRLLAGCSASSDVLQLEFNHVNCIIIISVALSSPHNGVRSLFSPEWRACVFLAVGGIPPIGEPSPCLPTMMPKASWISGLGACVRFYSMHAHQWGAGPGDGSVWRSQRRLSSGLGGLKGRPQVCLAGMALHPHPVGRDFQAD